MKIVEAEAVPVAEGKMYSVAKRDGDAPPGSRATSRMKGQHRDPGDPVGTIGEVIDGGVSARGNRSAAPSRDRKSDSLILPVKPPKETRRAEGRGGAEGDPRQHARDRTQSRRTLNAGLSRVAEAARKDKHLRFTALLHHIDEAALLRAFQRLRRAAAPGVDGQTVASYESNLKERLSDLRSRVHKGTYRPQPVLRAYIPKEDGQSRPLGLPAIEDKIVQSAVAEVLSAIYEQDFLGLSYGFRPGRSPHDALKALHTGLMTQYVNWVLDADIRRFFDSVDHEWLLRMVAHRVADPRILGLIRGWLKAGVMEGKQWTESEEGVPQGAGISPLLANIYLHYVLDLWVHKKRKQMRGRVILVRFADDFVMGFQTEQEAKEMLAELVQRMAKFGLELHSEKTRLIEFGKRSSEQRVRRGDGRPETFNFLGLTHYCGKSRDGRFVVKRRTERKRLTRKLNALRDEMRRRMHTRVEEQHRWLCSVLRGHYAYYGLPSNWHRLDSFRQEVKRQWYRTLRRRNERELTWQKYQALLDRLPFPAPRLQKERDARRD